MWDTKGPKGSAIVSCGVNCWVRHWLPRIETRPRRIRATDCRSAASFGCWTVAVEASREDCLQARFLRRGRARSNRARRSAPHRSGILCNAHQEAAKGLQQKRRSPRRRRATLGRPPRTCTTTTPERGNPPWRRLGARTEGRFAIWSYFLSWRCGVRKELPRTFTRTCV